MRLILFFILHITLIILINILIHKFIQLRLLDKKLDQLNLELDQLVLELEDLQQRLSKREEAQKKNQKELENE